MSGIPSKTTRNPKKQQNRSHDKEKNQSWKTDPELTQIRELSNKDMKKVIITLSHMFKIEAEPLMIH